MLIDSEALDRTLAHLRTTPDDSAGVEGLLQQVIDAAQSLFDVTGTGLMCIDEQHLLRYVAASDKAGQILEVAQVEHGIGPCVDAVMFDRALRTPDIRAVPRYAPIAEIVADEGVIGVLGVPVRLAGTAVGSLNVYSNEAREWDDADVEAVHAFVAVIETVISSALLAHRQSAVIEQLQYALDNRVVIERAIGVIMGRDGIDPVRAFNALRDRARRERRKVSELADEVLEGVLRNPS
ncbi:MAG: hypothetical protein JWL83_1838 [Actinomycetia bacterium]|nr:hypothetical protein [Actinomycetes bacterium]